MNHTISDELFRQLRAFVNVFANVCRGCNRRSQERCAQCDISPSIPLLAKLDQAMTDEHPAVPQSVETKLLEKYIQVLRCIKSAGGSAIARDISVPWTGYEKAVVLRGLIRRGFIRLDRNQLGFKVYHLVPAKAAVIARMLGED